VDSPNYENHWYLFREQKKAYSPEGSVRVGADLIIEVEKGLKLFIL
jgi:hypothetical protein